MRPVEEERRLERRRIGMEDVEYERKEEIEVTERFERRKVKRNKLKSHLSGLWTTNITTIISTCIGLSLIRYCNNGLC